MIKSIDENATTSALLIRRSDIDFYTSALSANDNKVVTWAASVKTARKAQANEPERIRVDLAVF